MITKEKHIFWMGIFKFRLQIDAMLSNRQQSEKYCDKSEQLLAM